MVNQLSYKEKKNPAPPHTCSPRQCTMFHCRSRVNLADKEAWEVALELSITLHPCPHPCPSAAHPLVGSPGGAGEAAFVSEGACLRSLQTKCYSKLPGQRMLDRKKKGKRRATKLTLQEQPREELPCWLWDAGSH